MDSEVMVSYTDPSVYTSIRALAAMSPSISSSVSMDLSTSITVMEKPKKPYVENHVPLAALQKPLKLNVFL
jgi:hypothetical protein